MAGKQETPSLLQFDKKTDAKVVEAKKKEDGDKEAPIDPENVNNPTEPMRIEERVRRKKKKKRAERRNPAGHCSTGERYKLFWMVVGLH